MKKYKLILQKRKLFRIKALRSFADVQEGDLGGYVETENNLSHEGNCWIYDNAQVRDKSSVSDNAQIRNNAQVSSNSRVLNDAKVYNNAQLHGNAVVQDNAQLYGHAQVHGDAKLCSNAHVNGYVEIYSDAVVKNSVNHITSHKHPITITETHMFIGCKGHTLEYWKKNIVEIGRSNSYNEEEIKKVINSVNAFLGQNNAISL